MADILKELARTMRSNAQRQATQTYRPHHYALVRQIYPVLMAELVDAKHLLYAEDIRYSQWVRHYDAVYIIDPGDSLVVVQMGNGDWLAVDVVSAKEPAPIPTGAE